MKIQRVLVDGYKNLFNVCLDLDRITALVSLNNFGKSNVLTAIDFAIAFIRSNDEGKTEMMSNSNFMPLNSETVGRNYRFEIEAIADISNVVYRIQYGFAFAWKLNEQMDPYITNEYLKVKIDDKGQKYNQLIERTTQKALYRSSETGRCSTKIKIAPNELIINKLKAFDGLYYADIVKKINSVRFYMETNLDAKNLYQPDPIIRKGLDDYMVTASNLPRVIYKLKNEYPDKFELLIRVYSELFPNIEDLIVRQFHINGDGKEMIPEDAPFLVANAVYVLYVKMNSLVQPINFELMSDGAKRVFMILTRVLLAKISNVSLVAIEEPENSVHPSLFRAYISILSQLMDDCKIIITSHSPYIISYMSSSWIHVGYERRSGIAEFYPFKSSGQKKLKNDAADLEMSMGDYLFSVLSDPDSNITEYLECDANE